MSSYSAGTIRKASEILGYSISDLSGSRDFNIIECRTIYTDLFTGDVVIDGYDGEIKKAFNGKIGGTEYYNEIILVDSTYLKTVTLNLTWGSSAFEKEIYQLLVYLEGSTFDTDDDGVSSKKIEDFSISYKTAEEKENDADLSIKNNFSFYIRKPIIVSVPREQRNDWRYF